jgi:hypothetical protein
MILSYMFQFHHKSDVHIKEFSIGITKTKEHTINDYTNNINVSVMFDDSSM